MITEQDWARIIAATEGLLTAGPRTEVLQLALRAGASVAPASVGASITQRIGTGFRTPAASGPLAIELDEAQYAADDGPCVQACRDGRVHDVETMSGETQFPRFTGAALARGVHSSLSLPLPGVPAAALNLYGSSVRAFRDPRVQQVAGLLARCVPYLIDMAPEAATDGPSVSAAGAAHRELVAVAVDALMARDGGDAGTAFETMTRMSRRDQRSIFDVARRLAPGTPATGSTP